MSTKSTEELRKRLAGQPVVETNVADLMAALRAGTPADEAKR